MLSQREGADLIAEYNWLIEAGGGTLSLDSVDSTDAITAEAIELVLKSRNYRKVNGGWEKQT